MTYLEGENGEEEDDGSAQGKLVLVWGWKPCGIHAWRWGSGNEVERVEKKIKEIR